jgi:outer membrane protein TolC
LRAGAATLGIGVAMADLYPDLTISVTGGRAASRLHELDDPQSLVWSLLMEAGWKVFAGGSLRANVDAAKARAEAAAANYAGAVLRALQEVEDALVREDTARRRYADVQTRVNEALAAESLANDRYQRGVESLITVLETERRRRIAQRDLLSTRQTVWDARINLILALGGDWQGEETAAAVDADAEPASEE